MSSISIIGCSVGLGGGGLETDGGRGNCRAPNVCDFPYSGFEDEEDVLL